MVNIKDTDDKLGKGKGTSTPPRARQDTAGDTRRNISQPSDEPSGPPPPYMNLSQDVPPRPSCTCPRREKPPVQGGEEAQPDDNGESPSGPSWGKVAAGAALVGVAAPVLAVAGAAVVLPVIGFGTSGVIGGSLAATVQSVVYGGATGGLFSIFQSVGATIAAPALSSVATAAGAAIYGGKLVADGAVNEGGNQGGDGAAEPTSPVVCQCVACVCAEGCECECRRGRRSEA